MNDKLFESVKDKSYFNRAIEWYCDKYLSCVVEKSWLLFIAALLLLCLCLLLFNIYLILPISRDLNFVKYADHKEDEFSIIRRLYLSKENDEYSSVASYLLDRYVRIYELSMVNELEYRECFIKHNSINRVYQEFLEKLSSEIVNSSSPKKNFRIDIVKLLINRSADDPVIFTGSAIIAFITEKSKKAKDKTISVSFTLSDIKAALSGIIPFRFIVNNYSYNS